MAKNTLKLMQLVLEAQREFPVNWMDTLDLENDFPESINRIEGFAVKAFVVFAKSILSGEYIIRDDIIPALDMLRDTLCHEMPVDNTDEQNNLIILKSEYMGLCDLISFNIDKYKQFIMKLRNRYTLSQSNVMVNAFRVTRGIGANHYMSEYFHLLFEIAEYDHLLADRRTSINNLILHHSLLSKEYSQGDLNEEFILALKVLDMKALFLIKKLLIDDNYEFDYLIDFENYHYDARSCDVSLLEPFDTAFEFYRRNDYIEDNYVRKMQYNILNGTYRLRELALLIKYYKDRPDSSLTQIDNLIKLFEEKYSLLSEKHKKREYDIYALNTIKNYMYNCRFSFILKTSGGKYDELVSEMDKIEDLQKQTRIFNFYPYEKAISHIISLLDKNDKLSFREASIYLEKLDYYIVKYEQALQWCQEQIFMPVQNVYNDSIVAFPDFGAVFVPSSFCRPVKYAKRNDNLTRFKTHSLFLKNEMSLREEREEIQSVKESIDRSQLKNIELLSIFTAIITFLFSVVSFTSNGNNLTVHQQIYHTVSVGLILMLFVSIISIVTIRKEKTIKDYFQHPRVYLVILSIISSGLLLLYVLILAGGQQDYRRVGEDGMSSKQEKATAMKDAGQDIEYSLK